MDDFVTCLNAIVKVVLYRGHQMHESLIAKYLLSFNYNEKKTFTLCTSYTLSLKHPEKIPV